MIGCSGSTITIGGEVGGICKGPLGGDVKEEREEQEEVEEEEREEEDEEMGTDREAEGGDTGLAVRGGCGVERGRGSMLVLDLCLMCMETGLLLRPLVLFLADIELR